MTDHNRKWARDRGWRLGLFGFDHEDREAVREFQERHDLEPTGQLNRTTEAWLLAELGRPEWWDSYIRIAGYPIRPYSGVEVLTWHADNVCWSNGPQRQELAVDEVVVTEFPFGTWKDCQKRISSDHHRVHLQIDCKGRWIQHTDLADRQPEAPEAYHKNRAIYVSLTKPDTLETPEYEACLWWGGGAYQPPNRAQCRSLTRFLYWIEEQTSIAHDRPFSCQIPLRWRGAKPGVFFFSKVPGAESTNGPRCPGSGVWAYQHINGDPGGSWPLLVAWLTLSQGMQFDAAYDRAIQLTQNVQDRVSI